MILSANFCFRDRIIIISFSFINLHIQGRIESEPQSEPVTSVTEVGKKMFYVSPHVFRSIGCFLKKNLIFLIVVAVIYLFCKN